MMGLGTTEIILIVLALLLLFGGKKIPEMMRGLGTGMREFKKATNTDEVENRPQERLNNNSQQSNHNQEQKVGTGASSGT